MSEKNKRADFYLEWVCRIHQEAAAACNRQLSDDALDAVRYVWKSHAGAAEQRPALFRMSSPHYFWVIHEATKLMAKAAELNGSTTIEPTHVKSGTKSLFELGGEKLACGFSMPPFCEAENLGERATAMELGTYRAT